MANPEIGKRRWQLMKRLSVVLSVVVIALLLVSLVISCTPKPKETVILRLNIAQPSGDDPLFLNMSAMAERFNERAGGEYEIKIYPSSSLVDFMESVDATRTGAVEMSNVAWGAFGGLDVRFDASELPFLYNTIRAAIAAQDTVAEMYDKVFREKFNQTAIACHTVGPLELISVRPVKTMADWDGLLVGTISPTTSAVTELLGGSAVFITWTDAYSSLEKGVIDATTQGTTWMVVGGLTDVCKYATMSNLIPTSHGYTVNLDVWNAMPQRIQDMLVEETQQAAHEFNDVQIQFYEVDHPAALKAAGVEIYYVPTDERAKWKAAVQPFVDERVAAMGDFGQQILQLADKVNSENP
jgi:TRAP-type C4-dicarboxylate transport system substrate-binding protein